MSFLITEDKTVCNFSRNSPSSGKWAYILTTINGRLMSKKKIAFLWRTTALGWRSVMAQWCVWCCTCHAPLKKATKNPYLPVLIFESLSICHSVHASDFVWMISPELLLTRLCVVVIIMKWNVVQKKMFTILKVKVIVRAYIIKIWLFVLYLLTAGPFATNTGLIVQHHKLERPWKIGILCSRLMSQQRLKCQWMFVWRIPLDCRTLCYQTWYGDAASWAEVSCRKTCFLCPRWRS